jgi:hypothetical protein
MISPALYTTGIGSMGMTLIYTVRSTSLEMRACLLALNLDLLVAPLYPITNPPQVSDGSPGQAYMHVARAALVLVPASRVLAQ